LVRLAALLELLSRCGFTGSVKNYCHPPLLPSGGGGMTAVYAVALVARSAFK
jgi:hypothetical protein